MLWTAPFLTIVCVCLDDSVAFSPLSYNDHHHHGRRRAVEKRRRTEPASASFLRLYSGINGNDNDDHRSLKDWHAKLCEAVATEDFLQAAALSKQMGARLDVSSMSWKGQGVAPWLVDRLGSLGFGIPTTIQVCALEAVNRAVKEGSKDEPNVSEDDNSQLEDRLSQGANLGVVISGTTGSGKTLAYAVPLLSTLSEALFVRQRLRISDEEAVGDTAGDLADRINVVTSPSLQSSSSSSKTTKTIATGASLGRSAADGVRSPLALIVVPSRELGVQTAKALYRLVGGSFREDDQVAQKEGSPKPPKYKGPKGVKIGTILDEEDATMGLKLQTDVAITAPEFLGKLIRDGDILPSILRVIAFDEADLSLERFGDETLAELFEKTRNDIRLTFLVGASVTESLGNYAVSSKILPEGTSFIATATSCAALTREPTNTPSSREAATLQDLNVCLYPDLAHERVIVPLGSTNLLVLTRLLRKELREYDEGENFTSDQQRPRVVVFFPDEKTAKAAIVPLRDALWGEHRLCVLLPTEGVMPLTIMDQFKRNETTVMLATPNSVRGLDFPALSHVYTTYAPSDPREYLHLAGRVGRVGHRGRGRVISVLPPDAATKFESLAATLGFTFTDIEAPMEVIDVTIREEVDEEGETFLEGDGDVEKMRRLLEDQFGLVEEEGGLQKFNSTGTDDNDG